MAIHKYETRETKKHELLLAPCIKCRKDAAELFNCGYSTFNVCGARCTNCKNEVTVNGEYKPELIAERWNNENDVQLVRAKLRKEIEVLRERIKNLKVVWKKDAKQADK